MSPVNSAGKAKDVTFRNEEYAFTVRVPAGHDICIAESWTHPHGMNYDLDQKISCKNNKRREYVSSIELWADYNAEEYKSTIELTPSNCTKSSLTRDLPKIDNLDTTSCVIYQRGGRITIFAIAMAGKNPAAISTGIYQLYLTTNSKYLMQDMHEFAKFISTVRIDSNRIGR